uniref:C2H2-type domain-containing protein n=1 Tax=Marseillevirus LCMAC101 TaxID=2506602 RepID=A0A481YRF5_9VIRU|nr:MAG: hypothetical protein LCMAC101_01370 [Marseillevirus LCMAC101]
MALCLQLQDNPTYQSFECSFCDKSYTTKDNLNIHFLRCKNKNRYDTREKIKVIKQTHQKEVEILKEEISDWKSKTQKLKKQLKEKDEEIISLKIKCEVNKTEVYDKVCTKVLDKSTITNNTAYIHPKLVNLPITNIHPLTSDYVKDRVDNGEYSFDNYLKGTDGLVDFIYSITMCENDEGDVERNYVCTDPSRDSYHRLVETKEWRKDKGGKFIDVILDTLSNKADGYHQKVLQERIEDKGYDRKKGYDPEIVYKSNNDMHTGIVRTHGPERRSLRLKLKKETSKKISV